MPSEQSAGISFVNVRQVRLFVCVIMEFESTDHLHWLYKVLVLLFGSEYETTFSECVCVCVRVVRACVRVCVCMCVYLFCLST